MLFFKCDILIFSIQISIPFDILEKRDSSAFRHWNLFFFPRSISIVSSMIIHWNAERRDGFCTSVRTQPAAMLPASDAIPASFAAVSPHRTAPQILHIMPPLAAVPNQISIAAHGEVHDTAYFPKSVLD